MMHPSDDFDAFAVEGSGAPAAQGGAVGAEPDPDWQPL